MRKWMPLLLVLAAFEWGCGSSNNSPSSPSSSGPTYSYPFVQLIGDFGISGSNNGQLYGPLQCAVYNNALFVADQVNRISKFDLYGNFLGVVTVPGATGIWGIVAYNGVLYVGDGGNSNVYRYDTNLNQLSNYSPTIAPSLTTDMAVDSTGRIYFASYGNSTIERCNNDGSGCVTAGGVGSGVGQFASNSLYGIAVDSSGNIYAVDQSQNRLEKFNSSLASPSVIVSAGTGNGQVMGPIAVAVDSDGNLLVSDGTSVGRLQKLNSSGGYITTITAPASYPFSPYNLISMAFDSNKNVYISDFSNDVVFKYAPY